MTYGVWICLECAGKHRGLGVHISFVGSLELDSWNESQINIMKHGGNQRAKDYFKSIGINTLPIPQKYKSRGAHQYSAKLYAEAGESFTKPTPSNEDDDNLAKDFVPHSESAPPETIRDSDDSPKTRVVPLHKDVTKMRIVKTSAKRPTVVKITDKSFEEILDNDDFDENPEPQTQQLPERNKVVYESYSNVIPDLEDDLDSRPNRQSFGFEPPSDANQTRATTSNNFGESAVKVVVDVTSSVASAIESAIQPIASAAWEKSKEFSQSLLSMMNWDQK